MPYIAKAHIAAPMPMRASLLVLAGALVLAGCTSPPASQTSGGAPPLLAFTSAEYSFTGPATAAPGWTSVSLRNSGQQLHHIQMMSVGTHTMDEVRTALMAEGEPPSWLVGVGGPNAVSPGSTERVVMDLKAGNHVLVCFIPGPDGRPHVAHGMMAMLKVEGAPNGAAPPTADATLDLMEFSFRSDKPLTAGTHTVKIRNIGGLPHEAPLIKLNDNASAMQFIGAFGPNATGPPPGRGAGGFGTLQTGTEAYAILTLSKGKYAYICFEQAGGKPHFAQGMISEFTVA